MALFHDARAPAGSDDEAMALRRDLGRPFSEETRQSAGILIVASHIDSSFSAFQTVCLLSGILCSARVGELTTSIIVAMNPSRTKKNDGVLDLFAAETRKGFAV